MHAIQPSQPYFPLFLPSFPSFRNVLIQSRPRGMSMYILPYQTPNPKALQGYQKNKEKQSKRGNPNQPVINPDHQAKEIPMSERKRRGKQEQSASWDIMSVSSFSRENSVFRKQEAQNAR